MNKSEILQNESILLFDYTFISMFLFFTDRDKTDFFLKEPFLEVFNVLKSDKSKKSGIYEKYLLDRLILKGEYSNNTKTGLWNYYNFKGDLEFCYDYSCNKFSNFILDHGNYNTYYMQFFD